jgi:hypothetical protein
MRHTLARALSIVGHPLCVVPLTSLVAIASHGLGWRAVWVTAIFFVSLSLIVLAFAWRQVRAGRWQDIDASNVTERRSLNYFLAIVLFIGAFISFRQSQPLGLTLGLLMSGSLVVLVMLLSHWVKYRSTLGSWFIRPRYCGTRAFGSSRSVFAWRPPSPGRALSSAVMRW